MPFWENVRLGSEIFNNFAIGISAVLGGWVLSPEIKRYLKIRRHKRQYPRGLIGKELVLVHHPKINGKIYLLDRRSKSRHWVSSLDTFNDLEYSWDDVGKITQPDFGSYLEGSDIHTHGTKGR